jgi:hypothetical protein
VTTILGIEEADLVIEKALDDWTVAAVQLRQGRRRSPKKDAHVTRLGQTWDWPSAEVEWKATGSIRNKATRGENPSASPHGMGAVLDL